MLNFRNVTLDDKIMLERYFHRYGEGSCQHSFVSLYCMSCKYGDQICEKGGFLFVLRSRKCTQSQRVYLFPMGDGSDKAALRRAVQEILDDAHAHGATVRFETVTERARDELLAAGDGRFDAEYVRDYAEYLYRREKLADLPGHEMASKRHDINVFWRTYGERVRVERIRPDHIEAIRGFQTYWVEEKMHREEDVQLELENAAIQKGLEHFQELGLSGIVVFLDDRLCGYAYGAPLNESCYDVIIEKGDRNVADIYRVLNRELVRLCCRDYAWINREEDVGVEGLRKAKLSYKPDRLLEKFVVTEVGKRE